MGERLAKLSLKQTQTWRLPTTADDVKNPLRKCQSGRGSNLSERMQAHELDADWE